MTSSPSLWLDLFWQSFVVNMVIIITITNTNIIIIILMAVSFMFPCWRCFMSVAISSEEADCALMFNTVSTCPPPRLGKKQQKAQQDYYHYNHHHHHHHPHRYLYSTASEHTPPPWFGKKNNKKPNKIITQTNLIISRHLSSFITPSPNQLWIGNIYMWKWLECLGSALSWLPIMIYYDMKIINGILWWWR